MFVMLQSFVLKLSLFLSHTFSHAYFPNGSSLNNKLNKLTACKIYQQPEFGNCHMLITCIKRRLKEMADVFDYLSPVHCGHQENDSCMFRLRRFDTRILGSMYSTNTVQELLNDSVHVFTNGFANVASMGKRIILLREPYFFFTPKTYSVWNDSKSFVIVLKKANVEYFREQQNGRQLMHSATSVLGVTFLRLQHQHP